MAHLGDVVVEMSHKTLTSISAGLAMRALEQSDHIEIASLDISIDAPICDVCQKPTWLNFGHKSPGRVICAVCYVKSEKARPVPGGSKWAWW